MQQIQGRMSAMLRGDEGGGEGVAERERGFDLRASVNAALDSCLHSGALCLCAYYREGWHRKKGTQWTRLTQFRLI